MKKLMYCLLIFSATELYSQDNEYVEVGILDVFHKADENLVGTVTHNYGINHLVAIAGSYALVETGFDYSYYKYMKDNQEIPEAGFLAVEAGALVPITVTPGLFIYGALADNRDMKITSLALAQSMAISLLWTSTFKAITGRHEPPDFDEPLSEVDKSTDFAWGFLNRGVYDGWPSGHTTTAFAMAATVTELYPEYTWLHIASYTYAAFIGLGISTNIHWFTDFFAGALMGYSIGKTVGSSFYELKNMEKDDSSMNLNVNPVGVSFSFSF